MSRAVPSQDSSPETFARLLSRLTQPPAPHPSARDSARDSIFDPLAEDYAVSVSISDTGTAALNANRKRAMAPVRVSGQTASRSSEAGEISYERALRLHSRPRPLELSELPPLTPSPEKPPPASQPSRLRAEARAISALRRAAQGSAAEEPKSHKSSSGQTSAHSPTAHAQPTTKAADSRRKPRNRKQNGQARPATGEVAQSTIASQPSHPQAVSKSQSRSPLAANPSLRKSVAATSGATQTKKPGERSSEGSPRKRKSRGQLVLEAPLSQPSPSSAFQPSASESTALAIEKSPNPLALAHRQSIVSIRLNAIEAEQLRQRAAESGISVSAYMRSCVLEAEHLRTQVKQALAELRASHTLTVAPQLDAPQLNAPPAHLSSIPLPQHAPSPALRPGLLGFLSGVFAIVLGRFQR